MAFRNPILAGTTLVRSAIQSGNYLAGHAGWQIATSGAAEFNNITIRGASSVGGTSLYYNGTPGLGTLVASVSATAGTDAFGNAYPAGVGVFSSGKAIILNNGVVSFSTQPQGTAQDGSITVNPGGLGFGANSGTNATYTDGCVLGLTPGTPNTKTGQVAVGSVTPFFQVLDYQGTSACDVQLSGTLIATDPSGGRVVWQSPTLGSGWAAGPAAGSVQPLHYRRDGGDHVEIQGALHTTSSSPSGTIFTLPPASPGGEPSWRPASPYRGPAMVNQSGAMSIVMMDVETNGNVSITPNLATSGSDLYISAFVPLGNIQ